MHCKSSARLHRRFGKAFLVAFLCLWLFPSMAAVPVKITLDVSFGLLPSND
jgi:hypothetical protein